jgi:predicted glycoside hydrolase/deacetylase ChbG (UPF0249 family)
VSPVREAPRRIWLCADDYGMAHGVNAAIRDLVMRERINATSVMVVAPRFDAADIQSLRALNEGRTRVALGLHLTLTAPFKPLSTDFAPTREGAFPQLAHMMRAGLARRLRRGALDVEIATQLNAFIEAFGRPPDFIDGHQHVHLLPQVRDALLHVAAQAAPGAWLRQCGRAHAAARLRDKKGLILDILSLAFRRKARRLGVATNPAFAGTYDFTHTADYAGIFPRFLAGLPDRGLIMCHPGFVDAELKRLDSLTALREREYDFFISDEFPRTLAAHGVALIRPEACASLPLKDRG